MYFKFEDLVLPTSSKSSYYVANKINPPEKFYVLFNNEMVLYSVINKINKNIKIYKPVNSKLNKPTLLKVE